jgi:DNA-binding GntR family transcriptional regulator
MSADLKIVRFDPLRVQTENQLRSAITSGVLLPGQKLIERDLCEKLGVSRPSLREALRRLEAEKLIVNIPHRGPMVATVSVEEARDLYAVRRMLEGHAAAECARHASTQQIRELKQAVDELSLAISDQSHSDILKAKQHFYAALLDGCGNTLVAEILSGLLSRISLLRSTSLLLDSRLPASLREIKAIFNAISMAAVSIR